MFSRFRLALFLTWSILIAMETGRTVTATRVQEKPSKTFTKQNRN